MQERVQSEGATELTEILLNLICKTFLPYYNLPIYSLEKLSVSTFYTICLCLRLISHVLSESDERLTEELIYIAAQKPQICKALYVSLVMLTTAETSSPDQVKIKGNAEYFIGCFL